MNTDTGNVFIWHRVYPCTVQYPQISVVIYFILHCMSVRLSIRPSICPTSPVHTVARTVVVRSMWYSYILSSNFRMCVACKAFRKISIIMGWRGVSHNAGILVVLVSSEWIKMVCLPLFFRVGLLALGQPCDWSNGDLSHIKSNEITLSISITLILFEQDNAIPNQ